jgi:hypothetical protein
MASLREQFRLGTLSDEEFVARTNDILASMPRPPFRHTVAPLPDWYLNPWGPHPPLKTDLEAPGPWPITYGHGIGPFKLFQRDTGLSDIGYTSAKEAATAWAALSEDEREAYRAKAQTGRRAAWAQFEGMLAAKDLIKAGGTPTGTYPGWVKDLKMTSAFEVFRDELRASDAGLGFWEMLERWEAMSDEQRAVYDQRAWAAVRAANPPRDRQAEREAALRAARENPSILLEQKKRTDTRRYADVDDI